jgi:hypothetical protein
MEASSPETRVYGKKFPGGYLFHLYFLSPPSLAGLDLDFSNSCSSFLVIPLVLLSFHRARSSYLKTTPDGLELHWLPWEKIFVSWNDVARLEWIKAFGLFRLDMLYLNRPIFEWGKNVIFLTEHTREFADKRRFAIPLGQFRGWPNGGLAEDVKRYVPHVFAEGGDVPDAN